MNNQALLKTSIKYGTILGLGNFIIFLIVYFMGKNPLGNWSWIGVWIVILLIILGTKEHRDKDLGGFMTYGRGLGIGMLITILGGLLFCVIMVSFGQFIDASIPQMQIDEFYAGMEKMKSLLSQEQYDKIMVTFEMTKDKFTMPQIALSNFEIKLVGGLIISLITAGVFMRRRIFYDDLNTPSSPTPPAPPTNDNLG
jgi:hypothetical protein